MKQPRRRGLPPAAQRDQAIGVFDSGIGGLTVVRQLIRLLPHEDVVYLGDTARTPYGTKSPETICRYALDNAAFLLEKGIKLLVVACNSVSAVALELLRQELPVPVVGVIEPGAKTAVRCTRNGKVGVIGTEATIASGAYTRALKHLAPNLEIYTRACPLFVPLAEEGWIDNEVAKAAARRYLASLKRSGIDTLVLGCTHYPLLTSVIAETVGPKVQLVDSAGTTAQEVRRLLQQHKLVRNNGPGSMSFFVTDAPDRFIKVGTLFLGQPVESAVRIER